MPSAFFSEYLSKLTAIVPLLDIGRIERLASLVGEARRGDRQVFICGNGGSAANALHMANDLLYGAAGASGKGLRVNALPANQSVVTCLANDLSYAQIYSAQIECLGQPGDVLIALSGSGNSENIVQAIRAARDKEMTSCAILGFSGGKCLGLADLVIHAPIHDMQISEDVQLIVGHMIMRWLRDNP